MANNELNQAEMRKVLADLVDEYKKFQGTHYWDDFDAASILERCANVLATPAPAEPSGALPKWIDDQKGKDQIMDDMIHYIEARILGQQGGGDAADERKGGTLYEAAMRAASELPKGYSIEIELERGYGGVRWSGPDCEWHTIDGEGWLCADLIEAIDAIAAIQAQAGEGGGHADQA